MIWRLMVSSRVRKVLTTALLFAVTLAASLPCAHAARPPNRKISEVDTLERTVRSLQAQVEHQEDSLKVFDKGTDERFNRQSNDLSAVKNSLQEKINSQYATLESDLGQRVFWILGLSLTILGFLGIRFVEYRVRKNIQHDLDDQTTRSAKKHRLLSSISVYCRLGYVYWRNSLGQTDSSRRNADATFAYKTLFSAVDFADDVLKGKMDLTPGELYLCLEAENQFLFHRFMLHRYAVELLSPEDRQDLLSRAHRLHRKARRDQRLKPFKQATQDWTETYALLLREIGGERQLAEEIIEPIVRSVLTNPDTKAEDLAYYKAEWPDVVERTTTGAHGASPSISAAAAAPTASASAPAPAADPGSVGEVKLAFSMTFDGAVPASKDVPIPPVPGTSAAAKSPAAVPTQSPPPPASATTATTTATKPKPVPGTPGSTDGDPS